MPVTKNPDEIKTKKTPEELRKLLQDAEVRLRDKKADKKSAMKCYTEDVDAIEEEIGDILTQLEEVQ